MQTWQRLLYWATTGVLIDFGFSAAASVGLPFLLIGVILLFFGIVRLGSKGFWVALVGFGLLPPFLILYGGRLYGESRCPWGWGITIVPDTTGGTLISCGEVSQSAVYIAMFFGAVALIGLVWGIVDMVRRNGRPDHTLSRQA